MNNYGDMLEQTIKRTIEKVRVIKYLVITCDSISFVVLRIIIHDHFHLVSSLRTNHARNFSRLDGFVYLYCIA